MANVQIDKKLFMQLYKYFNLEHDEELFQECKKQINDKGDKLIKREIYTQSKTAATEEDREQARLRYLDLIGMHNDFRY